MVLNETVIGDLSVLTDEFQRRDCVDQVIDIFEADENLDTLVMDPSTSFVIRQGRRGL